jgi:hypothetical protein
VTPSQRPDPGLLRRAIQSAIPDEDLQYFPPHFARALEPDVSLISGIRGSGKSELCLAVHKRLKQPARLAFAFEPGASSGGFPDKDTLQSLLQSEDCNPRLIWKTVFLSGVGCTQLLLLPNWRERYAWVKEHPDEAARELRVCNFDHQHRNETFVLLFDHFERMADTLPDRIRLLRGVLELMQDLRAFSMLRVKAFVNTDLLSQPGVSDFPGAARVLGSHVELNWQPADLYGLLYCKLGRTRDPEARQHFQSLAPGGWVGWAWPTFPPYWLGPLPLMDPGWQQILFGHLHTGGFTPSAISWFHKLPQDLTDSLGRISPRSFLLAVRTATEHYREGFPLVAPALQAGILAAARNWKQELSEELPWVYQAMERLKGLWVPLPTTEVFAAWRERGFRSPSAEEEGRASTDYDYERTLEQLQQVGVILRMADGRIEVPELYRVGFGLGRRGGFRLR